MGQAGSAHRRDGKGLELRLSFHESKEEQRVNVISLGPQFFESSFKQWYVFGGPLLHHVLPIVGWILVASAIPIKVEQLQFFL